MTKENILKYIEESEGEVKAFWEARLKRKYSNQVVAKEEISEPKPSKAKKKVSKE